jgi:hypothetical protein
MRPIRILHDTLSGNKVRVISTMIVRLVVLLLVQPRLTQVTYLQSDDVAKI